jgi:hypothetical protein
LKASNPENQYANITPVTKQDAKNVTVLLDILEEFDFYVRFNTVKLLVTLLYNRSDRIQECILTSPIGITRLIELLDDKREIIRNGRMASSCLHVASKN